MNPRRPDPTPPPAEWVRLFALNHIARFPRSDWPEARKAAAFFDGWAQAFTARRITQEEAEAASERMMASAPDYLDGHLTRLLAIVEHARGTIQNQNPPGPREPPLQPEEEAIVQQIVTTPFWWREMGR